MNCYQNILQKNVYRTSAGNCNEIASVVSLHRNDKNRGQVYKQLVMARGLAPRGHLLASCHRERSVAILVFVITSVAK